MDWSKIRLKTGTRNPQLRVSVSRIVEAKAKVASQLSGSSVSSMLGDAVEIQIEQVWQQVEPELVKLAADKGISVEDIVQHIINGGELNTL